MKRARRYFSPEEKVAVVRRHLLESTPVSDLCDEFSISPTQFYQWQKQLFDNGAAAFKSSDVAVQRVEQAKDRKIETLQAKLQVKNEVMAELLQEHVQLKKELGEP